MKWGAPKAKRAPLRKVTESLARDFNTSKTSVDGRSMTINYRTAITYRLECGHITTRVENPGTSPSKRLTCKDCLGAAP